MTRKKEINKSMADFTLINKLNCYIILNYTFNLLNESGGNANEPKVKLGRTGI